MHFVQKCFTVLGEVSVPHLVEVFILSFKNMNNYFRNRKKCGISKPVKFTSDKFTSISIIFAYIISKGVLEVADLYVLVYIQ